MHCPSPDDKPSPADQRRLAEYARIRGRLAFKNIKLTAIDVKYGLPAGTASNTLKVPHVAGERAIAAALGTLPHLLWRSRYFSDGRRKTPQPAENYRWKPEPSEQEAA